MFVCFNLLYSMVSARTESKSIDNDLVVNTVDIELTRLFYKIIYVFIGIGIIEWILYALLFPFQ